MKWQTLTAKVKLITITMPIDLQCNRMCTGLFDMCDARVPESRMHDITGSVFEHDVDTAYDRRSGGNRNRTYEPF